MNNLSKKTCYILGGKSLLIQCSEILLEHKFDIKGIVSDDTSIQQWAASHQIVCFPKKEQLQLVDIGTVDYVFSITHLNIIPDQILGLADIKAINFHDGILPGYAGLNVPTWSLYHQEKQHGITWHEMTSDVDSGNILKQVLFDIDEKETAFTLNAKCYEEASNSFRELLGDIESNSVSEIQQEPGESTFYGKCDRIPSMAVIDWQSTAQQIDALVRSLDYGPYSNPIGIAKLYLENAVYIVKETEVVNNLTGRPGEILELNNYLTISAIDNAIRISKLFDLHGQEISFASLNGLSVGNILPTLNEQQKLTLTEQDRQSCRYEAHWIKSLTHSEQLNIPFETHIGEVNSSSDFGSVSSDLSTILPTEWFDTKKLRALTVLFLSRLCNSSQFSIFVDVDNHQENKDIFIEHCIPVDVVIDQDLTTSDAIEYCLTTINQAEKKGGYCIDLYAREPELKLLQPFKQIVISTIENIDTVKASNDSALQIIIAKNAKSISWQFKQEAYPKKSIQRLQSLFSVYIQNVISSSNSIIKNISLINEEETNKMLLQWNDTDFTYDSSICVHQLFEKQAEKTPDSIAISNNGNELSYSELNKLSNKVAHYLLNNNIKPDQLVGVLIDRSINMLAVMMGILKSGAAYLPLDPTYPKDRIEYMLADGGVSAVITQQDYKFFTDNVEPPVLLIDTQINQLQEYPDTNPQTKVNSSNLAYTIYTSGSTGKPKGVMVEHRNVVNFFQGMDKDIAYQNGIWLAVTSISFDISVLEIFWTLANGFEVALFSDSQRKSAKKVKTVYPDQDMKFSMFYWNVAEDESEYDEEPYRLLLESAKFADQNEFTAVWTPERHFHAFGGLFPNSSVTSAAIASITKNVQIRGGSCVVPLHHPIRIAEEWAVVDNISNGRVGIAAAAGWQPNDFVIKPENHAEAKKIMFESVETVKRLWRGEELEFEGPKGPVKVKTLPRPKQKELPIWVTTAGNPDTFRQAGETGASILTHLLGQSVEDVSKNIEIYRKAYKEAGYEGDGYVTLLLHTLVGPDEDKIKEIARGPMKKYLKSAMFLVKSAAWNFPTFKAMSEETGKSLDEFFETISDEDLDGLLDFAFDRYYSTSGLFGSPERCLKMVDRLKEIGVNEIGCLIDYGLDTDIVLEHLPYLNELRKVGIKQTQADSDSNDDKEQSVVEILTNKKVTHLQCTPSMANMLVADQESANQLKNIKHMMVGGEAFPTSLATSLKSIVNGRVTNMYGPTETTIWSTTQEITDISAAIPIGRPISNTQIYILNNNLSPVPIGVPGELYIGGAGVVRGYHKREDLTQERFIKNPFSKDSSSRIYKTGDLAQYRDDGIIEYLGRIDNQIKIHGYRIELGEIETLLSKQDSVKEAVVILREDVEGDKRLVAYVITEQNASFDKAVTRRYLKEELPEFMVPSVFVEIQALPLTPNGKIDRKALPKPEQNKEKNSNISYVKPEGELQEKIAGIWQQVLDLPQVGLEDNFFDIGGHSLLTIEVLKKLREIVDKPLKMTDMFRFPTIHQISEYLNADGDNLNEKIIASQDRAAARKAAVGRRKLGR